MTIEINDMEFYAHHGCFEEEQQIGTRFLVDLIMDTPDCTAAFTDNLGDAVDYAQAYRLVAAQMEIPSKLIEHVAARILKAVTYEFDLADCTVRISKMTPALGGKTGRSCVTLKWSEIG